MSVTEAAAQTRAEAPRASRVDAPWHAAIPPSECHFALIEPAALGSPPPSAHLLQSMVSTRSPALDEAFERFLPCPIEELHTAYAVLEAADNAASSPPRIIACAIERRTLERVRDSGSLSASPAAWPEAVRHRLGVAASPEVLNFMTGEFEPASIRSAARLLRWITAASLLAATALIVLGLSRRAAHDEARAHSLIAATRAVEERAAAAAGLLGADPARVPKLLAVETNRLQSALRGPGESTLDAAALASDILSRWPRGQSDLFARLQNLQIVGTGVSLTIVLPADADPEPILAPLRSIPNWQLQPTQRSSVSSGPNGPASKPEARLNLRLVPIAPAVPTGPTPRPPS